MSNEREALIMMSVAVALAVYKALGQAKEDGSRDCKRCAELTARNRILINEINRITAEIDALRPIPDLDRPDGNLSPSAGWDEHNPPF